MTTDQPHSMIKTTGGPQQGVSLEFGMATLGGVQDPDGGLMNLMRASVACFCAVEAGAPMACAATIHNEAGGDHGWT